LENNFSKNKRLYFVIDCCELLNFQEVYNFLKENNFDEKTVTLKRIIKEKFNYDRLSILKIENETKMNKKIEKLKNLFSAKYKAELKLLKCVKNDDLPEVNYSNMDKTKILSLNINCLKYKIEQLNYYLESRKPTVICLQETRRTDKSKKIHLNGYKIIEIVKTENNNCRGLLIGVRTDSDFLINTVKFSDNILGISLKNRNKKIELYNIYVPCSGEERNEALKEAVEIIKTKLKKLL